MNAANGKKRREKIHVLFLIDQLSAVGGAEVALLNTTRGLPKDQFRCSVITLRGEESSPFVRSFPCPVRVLPMRRTYDMNAVRQALRLAQFVIRERVDIVHTFFASSDLWGGMIVKLCRRPALISSRRDMGILRTRMHHRAYRLCAPMFDQVLTVSDEVLRYTIEHDRVDPRKICTIHNGVDMTRWERSDKQGSEVVRARLAIPNGAPLIVTVANLRKVKGLDTFVRSAALVCKEFPEAMFLVVGGNDPSEPAYQEELQQLATSLGLAEKVRFAGQQGDVASILECSDVFCLLSASEGFSNALIEAMFCGLPCVVTRVGGNAEAIQQGINGFLVGRERHDEAASRLCELLRAPEMAKRMGLVARQVALNKFTSQVANQKLVEVYENVLAGRIK